MITHGLQVRTSEVTSETLGNSVDNNNENESQSSN
jgi:hypothetical protein